MFAGDIFEEYYLATVGAPTGYVPLVWEVRGPDGERVAGMDAEYFWGGLVISRLVVAPAFRRSGVGGWLMRVAMAAGRRLGATVANVSTFGYQAPDYYPRFGFKADFLRPGFRGGLVFHYMSNPRLAEAGASGEGEPRGGDDVPEREVVDAAGRRVAVTLRQLDSVPPELAAWFKASFAAYSDAVVHDVANSSRFALEACLPPAAPGAPAQRVGTILCKMFWSVLFISQLTVVPEARGAGVGTALMAAAVERGRAAGCGKVCVESFSFQAPGFYTRLGFTTDFVQPGWKAGATMHFFSAPLAPLPHPAAAAAAAAAVAAP